MEEVVLDTTVKKICKRCEPSVVSNQTVRRLPGGVLRPQSSPPSGRRLCSGQHRHRPAGFVGKRPKPSFALQPTPAPNLRFDRRRPPRRATAIYTSPSPLPATAANVAREIQLPPPPSAAVVEIRVGPPGKPSPSLAHVSPVILPP
jgi:hypothetical protein